MASVVELNAVRSSAKAAGGTRFSRRRASIITSAAQVFGRKGFHGATLDEIAAQLDVTKASLYYYFSTKEELLYEVHLLSMQGVIKGLELVRASFASPVEQLQEAIRSHIHVLAADYEGAFLLQQEYELPEAFRAEIVKLRDRYEHMLLEIIQAGVRQRLFRVKDARVVARMILGAVNWFVRWYRSGGRLTADEIADAYTDAILYGLLVGPSRAGATIVPTRDPLPAGKGAAVQRRVRRQKGEQR
jgi:TetR/AcrR family transcriptional regulator, cholesterol catabolism regulator